MTSALLRAVLPLVAAVAIINIACNADGSPASQPIVSAIPWGEFEEAQYDVLDKDGEQVANGTLAIQKEGATYRIAQAYESKFGKDETRTTVDASSLSPLEVERVIDGDEGILNFKVHYFSGIAEIIRTTEDDQRTDQINVPENSYDTTTSLFLWRTLPFRPSYAITYNNVLSAVQERSRLIRVTVRVVEIETVTTPAGTFEAWRVEIESGATEVAWYGAGDTHPLVKYDNGLNTFELRQVSP